MIAWEQKIHHKFIVESQGTLMAILPVHTYKIHDSKYQWHGEAGSVNPKAVTAE
jgi:hypothetical protein